MTGPTANPPSSIRKFAIQLRFFRRDRSGATAIEYSLIAMLVSITIIIAVTTVGETLRDQFFEPVAEGLTEANAEAP